MEFKQLGSQMDLRQTKKFNSPNPARSFKVQLEPRYVQLGQFFAQLAQNYPHKKNSAWPIFVDVVEENANDLMQGLHDLHTLGEEDWRFQLL